MLCNEQRATYVSQFLQQRCHTDNVLLQKYGWPKWHLVSWGTTLVDSINNFHVIFAQYFYLKNLLIAKSRYGICHLLREHASR